MSSNTSENKLVKIGETKIGHDIFREPNEVGGHRYWSTSVGGGVVIWDTCLASIEELEIAINYEKAIEESLLTGGTD
jgi:hypothetical protein